VRRNHIGRNLPVWQMSPKYIPHTHRIADLMPKQAARTFDDMLITYQIYLL
jgi:hypothetical protein